MNRPTRRILPTALALSVMVSLTTAAEPANPAPHANESPAQRDAPHVELDTGYLRGDGSDRVHFVGSPAAAAAEKGKAFVQVLERVRRGPLPFRAADGYLPHGVAWNKPTGFAAGRSNFCWAGDTFPDARFTGAIEIPYADARGVEVNADSARALGRDLARAALEHLEP